MVNAVNVPISTAEMEQYQNRHLRQIEHAARQWEARKPKVKNSNLRRQRLEQQNNVNYRNEYDRIRGYMAHRIIPRGSIQKQERRKEELHNPFSSGNV